MMALAMMALTKNTKTHSVFCFPNVLTRYIFVASPDQLIKLKSQIYIAQYSELIINNDCISRIHLPHPTTGDKGEAIAIRLP